MITEGEEIVATISLDSPAVFPRIQCDRCGRIIAAPKSCSVCGPPVEPERQTMATEEHERFVLARRRSDRISSLKNGERV